MYFKTLFKKQGFQKQWFKNNKVPHTLTREPGVTKLS